MAFLSGKWIWTACSLIVLVCAFGLPLLPKKGAVEQGGRTPLAATVLEWEVMSSLPDEFLMSPESVGKSLLKVKVKLKGLSQGVHPGYFLVDRINGGVSREARLEEGDVSESIKSSGELWDYQVLGQADPFTLPKRGECFLEMRFVIPLGFRRGVLDYRGRSLALVGP